MIDQIKFRLSTGDVFLGHSLGVSKEVSGDLVFTTGMVGYTEALTDPSYYGQILVFTFPMIGNYGVSEIKGPDGFPNIGFESNHIQVAGVVVCEESREAFHWASRHTLDQWLKREGVPGISGLDTRRLAGVIRSSKGVMGAFGEAEYSSPSFRQVLESVSCKERFRVGRGKKRIGLVDCGVKWNIVRQLISLECEVEILPWNTDFDKIDCQGWLLSNGPGDPAQTGDLRHRIAKLIANENKPILGICLGHQILALAAGAQTYRLELGHRSHNQPVVDQETGRGFLTSQNHGYAVNEASLPPDWKVWFKNANDGTVEGLIHRHKNIRSVQFHPEAAGGPRETGWIIEDFVKCL